RDIVQSREWLRRLNNELHRQAECARQWRRLERNDAGTSHARELLLQNRLKLVRGQLALVPRLEHVARNGLAGDVKLKHVRGLRVRGEDLVDLLGVHLPLLQRRVRRGDGLSDDNALILLRREFIPGTAVKEIDTPQDNDRKNRGDRQIVQASVQP